MKEQFETSASPPSEITIKEFIKIIGLLISHLWGYRRKLSLLMVLGGLLGFSFAHFFKKPTYTGRLTLVVEEKTMGGASNLMGLASQFGLDLGGGGGSMFSSENLILLLRSRKIIENALLEPQPDMANDHLLNAYLKNNYPRALKNGKMKLVPPTKVRSNFNRMEDSTLALVVGEVQKITKVGKIDKKASIIDLQLIDTNEQWAFLMTQKVIEKASEMYLDLKIGKTSRTLNILEGRVDSVKSVLDGLISAAAIETDQNQALIRMQARVPAVKKQIQIQMLTAMYGELVKNMELTRFTLEREEPVIQVIDFPTMPLKKVGKGRVIMAVLGSLILLLIGATWVLVQDDRNKTLKY